MSRAHVTLGRGPKSPGGMFQKIKFRRFVSHTCAKGAFFLPCFLGCVAFARALVAGAHDQPWSSPHTTKKTAKQRAGTTKDRQRTQLDAAKARKRPTHLFKQSKTFLATLFLTYICVRLWLLFTHSSYGRRRHTRSPKEIGILNPHP